MSQSVFTPAFLVTNYDDTMKAKLRYVGAQYSQTHKGYFITAEQRNNIPDTLPEGISYGAPASTPTPQVSAPAASTPSQGFMDHSLVAML
jgi:hypothetical protein